MVHKNYEGLGLTFDEALVLVAERNANRNPDRNTRSSASQVKTIAELLIEGYEIKSSAVVAMAPLAVITLQRRAEAYLCGYYLQDAQEKKAGQSECSPLHSE
jgi:hypothetical protein